MTSRPPAAFNAVYGQVPGRARAQAGPRARLRARGEPAVAEGLYMTCAGTDANYVAAGAFGLARLRGARGDVAGAVAALDLVPSTSRALQPTPDASARCAGRPALRPARARPGARQPRRGPAGPL